jgi:hypothetical protein
MNQMHVDQYITHYGQLVPSMGKLYDSIDMSLNPLYEWFKEQVEEGPGAYLGAKVPEGEKGILEASRRQTLYPAYILWARSGGYTPLSHRVFASELMQTCELEGIKVEKQVRKDGIFLTRIQLRPGVYHRDTRYASKISPSQDVLILDVGVPMKVVSSSPIPQETTLGERSFIDKPLYS